MGVKRRTGVRGFTIVEMAVVLAVMGLLLAFVLPQLSASASLSRDQFAKATLNSSLDTVLSDYGRVGLHGTWDTSGGTAVPPAPDLDATALHLRNPDVSVTAGGSAPSTRAGEVSADVHYVADPTVASWRVGVAALARNDGDDTSDGPFSCWYSWRDLTPASASSVEVYFVFDAASAAEQATCTGRVAAHLGSAASYSQPDRGSSWGAPVQLTLAQVQAAALG